MVKVVKVAALCLIFLGGVAPATPTLDEIVIYRSIDGDLTEESKTSLKRLAIEAEKRGLITLWITFDMDFEGIPERRTNEVIALELANKQKLIASVVSMLGSQGFLEETPTSLSEAPGCLISVNRSGLLQLAENMNVKHITYWPSR